MSPFFEGHSEHMYKYYNTHVSIDQVQEILVSVIIANAHSCVMAPVMPIVT